MINQENFSREMREEGLSKRTGTNIDERQLRMELKKLGNENHVNKLHQSVAYAADDNLLIFFLFFPENKGWHCGNNLHGISNPVFWVK